MHGRGNRGRVVELESLARASLVPLDDGEIVGPRRLEEVAVGKLRRRRAAVDHEQDWVATVPATDSDPLSDPADVDGLGLVDPMVGHDFLLVGQDGMRVGRRGAHGRRQDQEGSEQQLDLHGRTS